MKVGLLYPSSNAHPSLGIQFIEGIRKCLSLLKQETAVNLMAEGVGFGGSEKETYQKAEKLLVVENVDILVLYIDLKALAILEPLFFASGKLMIVVNPGANYPENWLAKPNMIHLTLHHAFLCWLSGGLATKQNNHPNALMATSFYDCGYLHCAAIVKHFNETGGNISFNHINKQPHDSTFHINEITEFLLANPNQKLLCVYDSKPAALFYDALNKFEGAIKLQLYVSPMMLEQKALEAIDEKNGFAFSIEGFIPWSPTSATEANQTFIDFFQTSTKKQVDIFALLGWETALILNEVLGIENENITDGEAIANHLKSVIIAGPRGNLKLDADTHYFLPTALKCSISNNSNHIEIEELDNVEIEWMKFSNQPLEGFSSGWTNTYLCY